jgi:hypothetical protein
MQVMQPNANPNFNLNLPQPYGTLKAREIKNMSNVILSPTMHDAALLAAGSKHVWPEIQWIVKQSMIFAFNPNPNPNPAPTPTSLCPCPYL